MKMFNSFNPGSAGFLNEAFMTSFYGRDAHQVMAAKAKGVEDIVIESSKQLISLKTLEKTRTDIEGSLKLLEKSLNDDQYGNKILYHLFIKSSSSEKINNLRMYEIVIRRSDIPIFYEDNIDSSKAYMGLVFVAKKEAVKVPDSSQTNPNPTSVDVANVDASNAERIQEGDEQSPVTDGVDYNKLVLKTVSFKRGKSELRDTTEFRVPESIWKKFISPGSDDLFLDLSVEKHQKLLKRAIDVLDQQVTSLFNTLEQFSLNITKFFADNNTQSGVKAYENAKTLEKETSKITKPEQNESATQKWIGGKGE